MNRVSKKDFIQYPNRYIKEGSFILTLYGKDLFKVTLEPLVTNIPQKVTTLEPETEAKVTTLPEIGKVTTNLGEKVTNKVTTLSKDQKIAIAKTIPGVKIAEKLAPPEITKEYPGIKTQAQYQALQTRQKEKEDRMAHYACGCKKKEGLLCPAHNRA